MLRDVLTEGIADPEIQLDLLGSNNQDMSLEEVFKFVESKEAGKCSSSHLLDSHAVESTSSSYRKSKQTSQKQNQEPCSYCGKKGHGRSAPGRIQRGECPAYGHRCQLCSRDHHLELVCQSKNKQNSSTDTLEMDECEGAIVNSLCTIETLPHKTRHSIALDNQIYDQLSDTWINKGSKLQPYISLTAKVALEDYSALGFRQPTDTNTVAISAMANTGCQSCLS